MKKEAGKLTTEIIKEWIEDNFEEEFKSLKRRSKKKNADGRIERSFECITIDGRETKIIIVSDYGDTGIYEIKHSDLTRRSTFSQDITGKKSEQTKYNLSRNNSSSRRISVSMPHDPWWDCVRITVVIVEF
jgi:hypothetical protein